jgi:hypothetical protein
MTFRNFAIVTALTSATAMAAYAVEPDTTNIYDDDGDRQQTHETTSELQTDNAANPNKHADDHDIDPVAGEYPDATLDVDGNVTAPSAVRLSGQDMTEADKTLVQNIVTVAEGGATMSSVDDLVIGKAVGSKGEMDADHLIYVDISEDVDIKANMLAFRASSLSVEESGGLEYALTLAQLREAVAQKVNETM